MQSMMIKMKSIMPLSFYLAVVMLWMTGCATTNRLTQSEIKFLQTRQIDRPFHQTYDAALNAMFGLGYSLTHTDKQSGIISGQWGDYGKQAMMTADERKKNPVRKVTLMVRPKGRDQTQLRMKMLIDEQPKLDRKLVTQLWIRIEREAMLDAGPSDATRAVYQSKKRNRK